MNVFALVFLSDFFSVDGVFYFEHTIVVIPY